VWEKFLAAIAYREFRLTQQQAEKLGTRFAGWLPHEIKRAEVEIGLWLGRMKEAEYELP
jgi:hypothetical protein